MRVRHSPFYKSIDFEYKRAQRYSIAGKYVVDAAIGFNTDMFYNYILIMIGSMLFTIILSYFSTLFTSYVGEKFAFSIRAEMFDRVQRSRWFDISKFHSADMLSRLTGDINIISNTIITFVPTIIVAIFEFLIVVGILLYYDPIMALIGMIVGPLGVIVSTVFRRKYVKYQKKLRESESEYYSFFQETLANLSVTKAFQLEDRNNLYFHDIRKQRLNLVMQSSKLSSLMNVLMKLIYNIGYLVAFSWCAYRLSQHGDSYTYGTMTLFLSLVSVLQSTITSIGGVIPQTVSSIVAAKRIREITDIENEDYTQCDKIPKKVGLVMENVFFTYEDEYVLHDVNLSVKSGEIVGIVGESGAGKTTFVRLLLSLTTADRGKTEYILDENEREKISSSSRRFISYVPQGNTLFSGTIRTNLLAANENATEQQLWDALETAEAADFVRKCHNGLDTSLAENSGGISEGQAQRIAIARALLRDKPVLILDEATSALDLATAKRIFERITQKNDKTIFVITHRNSIATFCDTLFEISKNGTVTVKRNK